MNAIAYLLGLEVLGMKFGLETMRRLCARLGHPERSFTPVIVAGTNGKGSVTAMVSAALHAAGYRVGRYTSPHLLRIEERFVIGEREVSTPELETAAAEVRRAVESLQQDHTLDAPPTFFECTTAAAFELFRRRRVEVAVLEVGLGGRLDATNVVTPVAAAITSIALDHQAQLGDSLASIAREKAGVIKDGIPVVCGPVPLEAAAVIEEVCLERRARLVRIDRDVLVDAAVRDGRTRVSIRTARRKLDDVELALSGRHQAENAAVAVALLDELADRDRPIADAHVLAGLRDASWPARLERFRRGSADVLLDAAHNPAGARALADHLRAIGWTSVTLIFGAMRDKDVRGMLAELAPCCRRILCTTAPSPRAASADEIAEMARTMGDAVEVLVVPDPATALEQACEAGGRVVSAGSIFLIGPLRGILR